MLHMMLRLEESRNKEQRKAGINYDTVGARSDQQQTPLKGWCGGLLRTHPQLGN
jgi:hypothetical protein